MCDLRSCRRLAVYSLDNCRVCKQHVDLAFAARVPSSRSLRRFFPWVWKLIQKRSSVPNALDRRRAVSMVMEPDGRGRSR